MADGYTPPHRPGARHALYQAVDYGWWPKAVKDAPERFEQAVTWEHRAARLNALTRSELLRER